MGSVVDLQLARREALPGCCRDCVFWQRAHGPVSDGAARERWARGVEARFGAWGRVLREGDGFRGMVQYAPARSVPRAHVMPAGPPTGDAVVITCAYLESGDRPGSAERLLLEALADLKGRRVAAVEAFALHHPDEVPLSARFDVHHTLFDRTFLQRFGFWTVRTRGQVSLMRLELGGLQPATRGALARLAARLHPHPLGAPQPAALRSRG